MGHTTRSGVQVSNRGGYLPLEVVRGRSFWKSVTLKVGTTPVDLTGHAFTAVIYEKKTRDVVDEMTVIVSVTPTDGSWAFGLPTIAETNALPLTTELEYEILSTKDDTVVEWFEGPLGVVQR